MSQVDTLSTRHRLTREELRATDAFTFMLIPHNQKLVLRVRLNYRLAKFLLTVTLVLLGFSVGGIVLLVLQQERRQKVMLEANIWQTRLLLVEERRKRILATLYTFAQKGEEMYYAIWGEEFVALPRGEDNLIAEEFIHKIAAAKAALRFFSNREDALQNMPIGMPLTSAFITSLYGTRISPFGSFTHFHSGIDFANSIGTPIFATADGIVLTAMSEGGGYGNYVRILHKHGLVTLYAHLNALNVVKDQWVKRGDVIGFLGQTGSATGPHLHYEVRLRNSDPFNTFEITLNPWPFVKEQL